MKQIKTLLLAAFAGALAFGAGKATAFPLYLTSFSGVVRSTASYGGNGTNFINQTSNKMTALSFNLKKVMLVVSNEVVFETTTNHPPADARIAYDPHLDVTYLTNRTGYYFNLSTDLQDIVRVSINQIATSFHRNGNGGSENDVILVSLYAQGTGPDDLYYEFSAEGQGSLSASVNSAGTAASMVISGAGSGYGQAKSSDAGVSQGKFTLKGSGKPETLVPYSIYWWNVLD